jgi:transcriptional regulator with XRE-family HTH domain
MAPDLERTASGPLLETARNRAGLSVRQLARATGISRTRIDELESGADQATERELGLLAQGCKCAVFDLLPPAHDVGVLVHDESGLAPARGERAFESLLREYLAMVVEMRSGANVTAPSLRHDDLLELAAALGDTPEAIEQRLAALLGSDAGEASGIRSMILPSTAPPESGSRQRASSFSNPG